MARATCVEPASAGRTDAPKERRRAGSQVDLVEPRLIPLEGGVAVFATCVTFSAVRTPFLQMASRALSHAPARQLVSPGTTHAPANRKSARAAALAASRFHRATG